MRFASFVLVAAFVFVAGCAPEPAYVTGAPPGRTFTADAPPAFDPRLLGVPLDASFHAAPGIGTLFPQTGSVAPVPVNRFNVEQKLVSTAEELAANAQAWAVDFNVSTQQHNRYAYFRAVQWTTAWQLQPNGPMLQPPPWARYYASKVYMGRSYVEVIQGDTSSFDAHAGIDFLGAPVGMSIGKFAGSHKLTTHHAGAGFVPGGPEAMFARTEQEIHENYRADGPEVPVAVEYTQLPTASPNGTVIFPEPRRITVELLTLDVKATGAMVSADNAWTMTGECTVNGQPESGTQTILNNSRVRVQSMQLNVPLPLIYATDEDQVDCRVQGTYERLTHGLLPLGPSNSGPISVASINGSLTGPPMQGSDANTTYVITWKATKN